MMNDIITNETVLDKHNKVHRTLVECLDSALYEIWEYSKTGNVAAHDFMYGKIHDRLVQFELDFQNADIPELNARATYERYVAIMAETMSFLNRSRNEHAEQMV